MVEIYQGDQYALEISLKAKEGELLTPDNVDEIHIGMGEIVKSFPGELEFMDGKWLFPLTREETNSMVGKVAMQAEAVRGEEITHGEKSDVMINETMVSLRRRGMAQDE